MGCPSEFEERLMSHADGTDMVDMRSTLHVNVPVPVMQVVVTTHGDMDSR